VCKTVAVLADGSIVGCGCRDLEGDGGLQLGHITDVSLREAYGRHLKSLRDEWAKNRTIPRICRNCRQYAPRTQLMLKEFRASS
jgi:hypothetical protein